MLVMLNTVVMMIVHLTMWDGGPSGSGLSAVQATAKHWQIGKKLLETTPHYFLGITVYSVYSVYYTQPLRTEGGRSNPQLASGVRSEHTIPELRGSSKKIVEINNDSVEDI